MEHPCAGTTYELEKIKESEKDLDRIRSALIGGAIGDAFGYDSVGNILVIHCSGGQNGVVVTGREGFAVAARPDLFTD